ncbi:MAG: DUF4392 domain-containing protein [Clostridiales bacterium]|nr:DUF4392 domain-containing protein [Clostridiales bacterium]
MDFYGKLNDIMTFDAGGRGLHAPMPDLPAVADTLLSADRVLVLTGFPVVDAEGAVHGETDGPLGAAEIACALAQLGCRVWLAADEVEYPLVLAAVEVYSTAAGVTVCHIDGIDGGADIPCGHIALLKVPFSHTDSFAEKFLKQHRITHFIPVERPGRGACGHYCSMRGSSLDAMVADTDCFMKLFHGVSVAVGDGGNELGMGKYKEEITNQVPHGEEIAAELSADYVLSAGVSNWWGPGLAALLSYRTGRPLLAGPETEEKALAAVLAAGGLDGCTAKKEMTVDALPLSFHLGRRELVRQLLAEAAAGACAAAR